MDAGIAPTSSFIPLPGYREITRRQQMGKPGPSGEIRQPGTATTFSPRPRSSRPLLWSFAGAKAVHHAASEIGRKVHPGGIEGVEVLREAPAGVPGAVQLSQVIQIAERVQVGERSRVEDGRFGRFDACLRQEIPNLSA